MSTNLVNAMFKTHSDSWFWIIIFFVLSFILLKTGKNTLHKISQGLFRLVALVMIFTGIAQLVTIHFPAAYVVKGILAIAMIGTTEMIVAKAKRGNRTGPLWVLFVVLLALVLLLAYRVISF